jgi:hypothetical protein
MISYLFLIEKNAAFPLLFLSLSLSFKVQKLTNTVPVLIDFFNFNE